MIKYLMDEIIDKTTELLSDACTGDIREEKKYFITKQMSTNFFYDRSIAQLNHAYADVDPEAYEDYRMAMADLEKFRTENLLPIEELERIISKEFELCFPERVKDYKCRMKRIMQGVDEQIPLSYYRAIVTIQPDNNPLRMQLINMYEKKEKHNNCIEHLKILEKKHDGIEETLVKKLILEQYTKKQQKNDLTQEEKKELQKYSSMVKPLQREDFTKHYKEFKKIGLDTGIITPKNK